MPSTDSSLRKKVFSGFLWRFTEKTGANILRLVVSIILARLIVPEIFGIFALALVFTSFADLLVIGGFGMSLVQKENADEVDFSSVFYFTTAVSLLLYALLFFAAPIIADFYEHPEMISIMRVMNLHLFISGFGTAQTAYVNRNLLFKCFFWSTGGGAIVSAAVALTMAFLGFGVWALVAQFLSSAVVSMIILWFTVNWRPTLDFSWHRMKGLYSFGWKLLLSNVISRIYSEIRTLLVGRIYNPAELAYYTRGRSFPELISDTTTTTIGKVFFPAITKKQKSTEAMKNMMRQTMSATSYIMFPMMLGLAIIAEPLVLLLLTEKWIEAVPFLQIACLQFALLPIHSTNMQAINAIGRSDITLKLSILKTIADIGVLLLVMRHGVFAIALSTIFTSLIFLPINMQPNSKLINYRFTEQMADVLPYFGLSAVMGAAIYTIHFLQLSGILTILLQIISGVAIYILLSIIFKIKAFHFIVNTARSLFPQKTK